MTNVTYNYTLASQGKYPNGTRLDVYRIVSEPILTQAIHQVGLQGVLTWKELADMLTVEAVRTRIPEDAYIATEYRIQIDMDAPVGGVYARDLLDKVISVYFQDFNKTYVDNQLLFTLLGGQYAPHDYREMRAMFSRQCKLMASYVSSRVAEAKTFTSTQTNETFSSLLQRINDFSTIMLEKYSAYITNHGLSGDYSTFFSEMEYKITHAKNIYARYMDQYNVRLAAINTYQPEQSAIVMIPTRDQNKEFYMSKTKVGVDYLSDVAVEYMEKAKNVQHSINMLSELLENAKTNRPNSSSLIVVADAMTQTLQAELNTLQELIVKTDNDYIKTNRSQLLIKSDYIQPLTAQYGLKYAAVAMLATFAFLVALAWPNGKNRKRGRKRGMKHAEL